MGSVKMKETKQDLWIYTTIFNKEQRDARVDANVDIDYNEIRHKVKLLNTLLRGANPPK
jgi:hypothetical protein